MKARYDSRRQAYDVRHTVQRRGDSPCVDQLTPRSPGGSTPPLPRNERASPRRAPGGLAQRLVPASPPRNHDHLSHLVEHRNRAADPVRGAAGEDRWGARGRDCDPDVRATARLWGPTEGIARRADEDRGRVSRQRLRRRHHASRRSLFLGGRAIPRGRFRVIGARCPPLGDVISSGGGGR